MRNIFYCLLALSLSLFLSCRKAHKDIEEYYPAVKMISVTPNSDGELVVSAEIESIGAAELEGAGFCMDTIGNPTMLENQQLSNQYDGETFSAKYKGLNQKKKYYFRCFAANHYGYKYSDVIVVNGFSLPAAASAPAPCSPPINSYSIGLSSTGSTLSGVSAITNTTNGWVLTAYTNSNLKISLTFGSKPVTKTYKAVANYAPAADQVAVELNFGFNIYFTNPVHSVYVTEISTGVFEITICRAPWQSTPGTEYYFTTKFQANL